MAQKQKLSEVKSDSSKQKTATKPDASPPTSSGRLTLGDRIIDVTDRMKGKAIVITGAPYKKR